MKRRGDLITLHPYTDSDDSSEINVVEEITPDSDNTSTSLNNTQLTRGLPDSICCLTSDGKFKRMNVMNTLALNAMRSGNLGGGEHVKMNYDRVVTKHLARRVCSRSFTYQRVAQFDSKYSLHYDQNKIYTGFDAIIQSYTIGCYDVVPEKFNNPPFAMKIKDYLFIQGPTSRRCEQCERLQCCQPSLLGLSVKNSRRKMIAVHLSASTGYIRHFELESVSSEAAHLEWNVSYETACVTTHVAGRKLFRFYLFSVLPIKYLGAFSINKNLKGNGVVKKIVLSMDMLILHEGRDTVSLYSMRSKISDLSSQPGEYVEVKDIDELAPALVVVKGCHQFDLQIGGFPYRLLISTANGHYIIKSIDQREVFGVINEIDCKGLDKDTVGFDETEAGLIIQKGEHMVRVFKIPKEGQSCTNERMFNRLTPVHTPTDLRFPSVNSNRPITSRSGRTLSRRPYDYNTDYILPSILCELDLEDELDLLFTLTCDHLSTTPSFHINILAAESAQLLKREKLDMDDSQQLFLHQNDIGVHIPISVSADRDLLIVTWKHNSRHHMILYQLKHRNSEVEVKPKYIRLQ